MKMGKHEMRNSRTFRKFIQGKENSSKRFFSRRSQFSMEFIAFSSILMIFGFILMILVYQKTIPFFDKKINTAARDIAIYIETELSLPAYVHAGYHRNFTLPARVHGYGYNAAILNEREISVTIQGQEQFFTLPVDVHGTLAAGINYVIKNESGIFVNP